MTGSCRLRAGKARVTTVTVAHRERVLALFAAVNDATGGTYAPSVSAGQDTIGSWFDRKHLDSGWVIEDSSGLVGHVGVRTDPAPALGWGLPAGPAWVEVARLAVHPRAWRQGYARSLMQMVQCGTVGEPVWLTCHRDSAAHMLYRSLGWLETSLPIRWDDDPAPGVLLTRGVPGLAGTGQRVAA